MKGLLWRDADFLRLWAAQTGSAFGSRISRTALPIIAVLSLHAPTPSVAWLSALTVAPAAAVALFFSGAIERHRKRATMITCDLVRCVAIASIPVCAWLGMLTMPLLYAIGMVVGAAGSLFQIANASYLPVLIARETLIEGNAKLEATDSLAETAGPGAAGALIQVLSAPGAMVIDAISYAFSALLLMRVQRKEPVPHVPASLPSLRADLRTGLALCLRDPLVARILVATLLSTFFGGFFMALYMVLALRIMDLSPLAIGLVISVGGVGSIAGALLAQQLGDRFRLPMLLLVALALGQGADLCIPLAPGFGQHGVWLLLIAQLLGDGALTVYAIHAMTARQTRLPLDGLARSSAVFQVVEGVALPLGALVAAGVAVRFGVIEAMWISAAGGLASVLALIPWQKRIVPTG
jgi:predicted MFS family arabinose efflux permease